MPVLPPYDRWKGRESVTDLAAALAGKVRAQGNQACRLCVKLGELPQEEAEAVRESLRRGISIEDLFEALRETGNHVPRRDVRLHKLKGHTT